MQVKAYMFGGPDHGKVHEIPEPLDYFKAALPAQPAFASVEPTEPEPPKTMLYEMVRVQMFGHYLGAVYLPVGMPEEERAFLLLDGLLSDLGKAVLSQ